MKEAIKFFEDEIYQFNVGLGGILKKDYREYLKNKKLYYEIAAKTIKEHMEVDLENRIAKFDKVSFERFKSDWKNTIRYYNEYALTDIYNIIKSPQRATSGSAGYDIFAPIDIILKPGETFTLPTGLRCKIDSSWFMGIFPRSGLGFKYAVRLSNTVGIIDSDYYFSDNEGHIFIKLINDSSINKTVEINQGEGIAQAIFMPFGVTTDDKCNGIRNGGLGSTTI